MIPIDLSGRICLVTGGAGQLGRTMVRTLCAAGADVAVHYRTNQATAQLLVEEARSTGRKALSVQADISSEEDVSRLREAVLSELGTPWVVVTNAVAQYEWTNVLDQPLADYESQFRTCVMQNVLLAKAFVPPMIETGRGGRFVGINTECAMQSFEGQSAYVSGKRGMDGVLRVLAKEIGRHNITVNQVAPGWTISDRDRQSGTETQARYQASVPLGRRGTDQEVANAVLFLVSDLASFITGAYLPVCGGNVMPCI